LTGLADLGGQARDVDRAPTAPTAAAEEQQPAEKVDGADADGVGEQPCPEQAEEPAGVPEHVDAGGRPTAEVPRDADWTRLLKVTFPVDVDRP
jgi:hypothetical protein